MCRIGSTRDKDQKKSTIMQLQITTLVENSQGEHLALKNEHGIAFYIEKNEHRILFDTGQSDAFIRNAAELKKDMSRIDSVVLSHGHYDHSGGFRSLVELTDTFHLYTGSGFFQEKFGYHNHAYEYLGNNFDRDFLEERSIAHTAVSDDLTEIAPGVYIITNFARIHPEEVINERFVVMKEGKFYKDDFSDEVLIAIDTSEGLVVLLGCSHPGMRNMLDSVKERLGKPLYAVLGGTHLVESKGVSYEKSLRYLHDEGIKIVGVSHCTGSDAMSYLRIHNDNYFHNRTGTSLRIE